MVQKSIWEIASDALDKVDDEIRMQQEMSLMDDIEAVDFHNATIREVIQAFTDRLEGKR